jgi:hypothetical protein
MAPQSWARNGGLTRTAASHHVLSDFHDDRGLGLAGYDPPQPLVPRPQRTRFAFKHVAVHVMAYKRPGVFATRLMTDDGGNQSATPISASMVANVRLRSCEVNTAIGNVDRRVNR